MRVFIAIDLPKNIKKELYTFYRKIKGAKVKLVEEENLHITLRFLGELTPDTVKRIIEELKNIEYESFYLKAKGLGFFPNEFNPRVVWVGIQGDVEKLIELKKLIDSRLRKFGFPLEKDFVPHITVARVKQIYHKKEFFESLEPLKDYVSEKFEVKNFVIKKSTLTSKGPIYEDLHVFEL